MKKVAIHCCVFFTCFAITFSSLFAQPMQLLSVPDASQPAADSGSGDSVAPIISADGRYVLFASTANNLVVIATNKPIPAISPAPMNVYLRDRVTSTTSLVSVNLAGTGGGNDNSWPIALSTNGQSVLFESSASDLVAGDTNNATDIFVRNLVSAQTLLVSVNTNGVAGDRDSSGSTMTPDGRFVAFVSKATDLLPGDTNDIPDIFLRDLQSSNTVLVSIGALSVSSSNQPSISPEISPDGRYIVFTSVGTNLVPGVQTTNEIYLRDMVAGTTTWVSSGATQAVQVLPHPPPSLPVVSFNYILSADGRYVAYEAYPPVVGGNTITRGYILRYDAVTGLTVVVSTNAVAYLLGNNRSLDMTSDGRYIAFAALTNDPSFVTNSFILVWDAQVGAATLASGDLGGHVPTNSICSSPVLDPTGRFVAFLSSATNLVTNTIAGDLQKISSGVTNLDFGFHLYLRDLQAASTVLIDADTNAAGASLKTSPIPSMSADGRFVAFESADPRFVPRDSNRNLDVFVRDTSSNATELISCRASALPSNAPNWANTLSLFSVSSDGRFFAFSSDADNLVANDTNNCRDIVVRDLLVGTNFLVSANTNNLPANNFSTDPAISGDGRFVAFTSAATDLVPGDSNKALDVFLRDLQSGITTQISVNSTNTGPGNRASFAPLITADGRFALFHSAATDLAPGSYSGTDNLFLRDRQSGITTALTMQGVAIQGATPLVSMTPDGHYIAFVGAFGSASNLFVWDTQASSRIFTNSAGVTAIGLSPNGRNLVYGNSSGLYVVDPIANSSSSLLTASYPGPRPGLRFSADSRFLIAALCTNLPVTNQIYLFDLQTSTNLLISNSYNTSSPANGGSDSPDISADGRFIAYRSVATDILPSDTIVVPDIFLYDNQTSITTLLSESRFGSYSADNRSRLPVFSADGKILFFESSASDLVSQTFNFNPNIFAYGTYVMPPFHVAIMLDTQGPLLSWPTVPGKSYQVQFKNTLNAPLWQDLNGDIFFVGSTEYFRDTAPSPLLRFYRVKSF
jgi:Tol biopolymer transport system component